ncbi:MAG: hypothetical protein ACLU4J_25210 [Butyricimonas paravirosa]
MHEEIIMNDQTVICAIATAPGMGAIAVIRLSGKDVSKSVTGYLFHPPVKN